MLRTLATFGGGALLLASLVTACTQASELTPTELACVSDDGCATGMTCDFNHCVVAAPNQLVVAARIIPPADTDQLTQQLPMLDFRDGADRLITLVPPARVRGVVISEGDSFIPNIPGAIELRAAGEIPGIQHKFTARSTDGLDADFMGYTVDVLPGRTYSGTFRPDDVQRPPFHFTLSAAAVGDGRYDIVLPAHNTYTRVSGRVRELDYTPVGAARVVILLEDGSVAHIAETDRQRGRFEALLPPRVKAVRFKVQAPVDGQVFPEFTTELMPPSEEIDLKVPPLPAGAEPFAATIHVWGPDERGTREPAAGVTVTIVGELAGGTLRATSTTNDEGVASFTAFPGAYECLISVPDGSRFSSWHGRLTLAQFDMRADAPATVNLGFRVPLRGTVRAADGGVVSAGIVEARLRPEPGPYDVLVVAPPPRQTDIHPDGTFATLVDPGFYDVRVVPAPEVGAPPHRLEGVVVDGAAVLDVSVPPPALAHLTVAASDGTFISGATVELFELTTDDNGTAGAELFVRGTTGEAGFVDMVVPFVP